MIAYKYIFSKKEIHFYRWGRINRFIMRFEGAAMAGFEIGGVGVHRHLSAAVRTGQWEQGHRKEPINWAPEGGN